MATHWPYSNDPSENLFRSTLIFSAARMRSISIANNNFLEGLHLDLKGIIDRFKKIMYVRGHICSLTHSRYSKITIFFLFKTIFLGSENGIRLMLNTKFEWRSEQINHKSIRHERDFSGGRDECSKSEDYSVSRELVSKLQYCLWALWALWVEPWRTVQGMSIYGGPESTIN